MIEQYVTQHHITEELLQAVFMLDSNPHKALLRTHELTNVDISNISDGYSADNTKPKAIELTKKLVIDTYIEYIKKYITQLSEFKHDTLEPINATKAKLDTLMESYHYSDYMYLPQMVQEDKVLFKLIAQRYFANDTEIHEIGLGNYKEGVMKLQKYMLNFINNTKDL